MVLHVVRASEDAGREAFLEHVEELLERLAHDEAEDGQPAAVRGTHHDALDPAREGSVENGMQGRDDGFRALEREPLLTDEGPLQEALELLGLDEVLEDGQPLPGVEDLPLGGVLHPRDEPFAHVLVLDVEKLGADVAAIDAAEAVEH